MLKIRTWLELQMVKQAGYNPAFQEMLEAEFNGLWEHLGEGTSIDSFDLSQHGPLCIADAEERSLTKRGLLRRMGVTEPEFIEKHRMTDGRIVYRVGFLLDNDFLPMMYALADELNPEVAAWLEEEADQMNTENGNEVCIRKESPF